MLLTERLIHSSWIFEKAVAVPLLFHAKAYILLSVKVSTAPGVRELRAVLPFQCTHMLRGTLAPPECATIAVNVSSSVAPLLPRLMVLSTVLLSMHDLNWKPLAWQRTADL